VALWLAFCWSLLTVVLGFLTAVIFLVGGFAGFFVVPFPIATLVLALAMRRGPSNGVLVGSAIVAAFLTAVGVAAFVRGSQGMPGLDAAVLVVAAATFALSLRALLHARRGTTGG
jgi:hypothetical protein